MPGHRSFALLRARTRGQRRRRTLHTNLEGEPALGEDLRYDRKAARRARRVRHALQRNLARRTAWIQDASTSQSRANDAATCDWPTDRPSLILGRLNKRSRMSQNRAAVQTRSNDEGLSHRIGCLGRARIATD